MINKKPYIDEISEYVRKNLKKGYTKDSLRVALITQGYSKFEVDKAIKKAEHELASQAPKLDTKPVIKYESMDPKNMETYNKEKKSFWKRLFG